MYGNTYKCERIGRSYLNFPNAWYKDRPSFPVCGIVLVTKLMRGFERSTNNKHNII